MLPIPDNQPNRGLLDPHNSSSLPPVQQPPHPPAGTTSSPPEPPQPPTDNSSPQGPRAIQAHTEPHAGPPTSRGLTTRATVSPRASSCGSTTPAKGAASTATSSSTTTRRATAAEAVISTTSFAATGLLTHAWCLRRRVCYVAPYILCPIPLHSYYTYTAMFSH